MNVKPGMTAVVISGVAKGALVHVERTSSWATNLLGSLVFEVRTLSPTLGFADLRNDLIRAFPAGSKGFMPDAILRPVIDPDKEKATAMTEEVYA